MRGESIKPLCNNVCSLALIAVSVDSMAMQFSQDSSRTPMSASKSCIALSSCASTSVKIGGLWKRSQGVSRFTKSNYKHRVFILTDQALSYYGGTVDVSRLVI